MACVLHAGSQMVKDQDVLVDGWYNPPLFCDHGIVWSSYQCYTVVLNGSLQALKDRVVQVVMVSPVGLGPDYSCTG
ncbi:hypothetical protein G9A89_000439 [Geosiphon pyriformis]|nr:hypothetical protein G9A89_000439 [Geosiphon pyriformis]